MKDRNTKRGKIRQNWIKPDMALRGIHFFSFVRANRLREKRREEKKRREEEKKKNKKKKRREEKEEKRRRRNQGMDM